MGYVMDQRVPLQVFSPKAEISNGASGDKQVRGTTMLISLAGSAPILSLDLGMPLCGLFTLRGLYWSRKWIDKLRRVGQRGELSTLVLVDKAWVPACCCTDYIQRVANVLLCSCAPASPEVSMVSIPYQYPSQDPIRSTGSENDVFAAYEILLSLC